MRGPAFGGWALLLLSLNCRPAAAAAWPDYQVLLWQNPPPGSAVTLRALGITGTKLLHPLAPDGIAQAAVNRALGLRWFDENLATDFYAAYHRWRPDRSPSWLFDQTRARHAAAPGDLGVFERAPSLSDPVALAAVTTRLAAVVRAQAPDHPLYYNLGDESGIADLAAAWDFDLSAPSLVAMRAWLRDRYGSLAALNHAWGSRFAQWDAVRPALTRDAVRDDAAIPSWMDFKAWMDAAFARAVRAGAAAIHGADPTALAALEGAQAPGWGGYDYGRLAGAVDVMEIYDLGDAIAIAHSLDPALTVLTTTTGDGGASEQWRLWHAWLLGARGAIVWDDSGQVIGADGRAGTRGLALAPVFRRLEGPFGAAVLRATPAPGQVAILYSQASFRLTWLLDRRADRRPWETRDAAAEGADNAWRAANRRAARLLTTLGAQPRWITPEMLTAGVLGRDGTRVLVLPHSLALSDAAVAAVRRFAEGGGTVLADTPPGGRDERGRARAAPPLADLVALPQSLRQPQAAPDEMAGLLARAGVALPVHLLTAEGRPADGLDVHLFRDGDSLLAGILRRDDIAGPRTVTLRLAAPMRIRDLGSGAEALADRMTLALDPAAPTLLALRAADAQAGPSR